VTDGIRSPPLITHKASLGLQAGHGSALRERYPDDVLFGLGDELALELLGHLRVEELGEGPLDGHGPLPVPLLHLVAELVPVVELLDLVEVRLVPGEPIGGGERDSQGFESMTSVKHRVPNKLKDVQGLSTPSSLKFKDPTRHSLSHRSRLIVLHNQPPL